MGFNKWFRMERGQDKKFFRAASVCLLTARPLLSGFCRSRDGDGIKMPSNCFSASLYRPREYAYTQPKSPQVVSRGVFLDGLEEEMAVVTSVPSADLQPRWEKQRPHLAASSRLATGWGQKQEAKSRMGLGGGTGSFGVRSPPLLARLLLCRLHGNWVCLTS